MAVAAVVVVVVLVVVAAATALAAWNSHHQKIFGFLLYCEHGEAFAFSMAGTIPIAGIDYYYMSC